MTTTTLTPLPSADVCRPGRPVLRRVARAAGPLLFFLLVGGALMVPFFPRPLLVSPGGDLANHVSGIVEATNALRAGQFPLRTAPTVVGGRQYPFFSYYGNLPYTLGALFCAGLKVGPYAAYKLVLLTAYAAGGWYAYRVGLWLTRRPGAAIVAGAAFVTAPYAFTDFHARAAFTEAVSMAALPAAAFYALRCFARRGRPGDVLASGVAWSALSLSHNLTYLFGGTFVCLMLLATAAPRRAWVMRMLRVGAGFGLGVALALWYLAPALATVPSLRIALIDAGLPFCAETMTPLDVLLSPTARTPIVSGTPRMDLQFGWPMLAAAAATLVLLAAGRRLPGGRRVTAAVLATFLLACFAAWSPDRHLWAYLPAAFRHVQSSSRLLIYTALFGSMLVALVAAALTPRGGGGRRERWAAAALLVGLGVASQSFVSFRERWVDGMEERAVAAPNLGGNGGSSAYLLQPAVTNATTIYHPGVDLAQPGFGLVREQFVDPAAGADLPAPPPGSELELSGTVPPELPPGVRVRAEVGGAVLLTPPLAAGAFAVRLPTGSAVTGPRVQLRLTVGTVDVGGQFTPVPPGLPEVRYSGIYFRPPAGGPDPEPFVPAAARAAPRRQGTVWQRTLAAPALVQLPALYYPGVLRVTDNDQPIPYGNVGRLVAVRLGAGPHRVRVTFAGVRWANAVSAAGWAVVLVGGGVVAWRRARRRARSGSGGLHVGRPAAWGPVPAVVAAGLFGGAILWPHAVHAARAAGWWGGPRVAVEASRASADPRYAAAAAAFDGDPTTAWAVGGAGGDVVLTVRPDRPARLRRIVLDARWLDLIEGWHQIRIDLYQSGKLVRSHSVRLPDAHREPSTEVKGLPRVEADRIELRFSDPVLRSRDEARVLPPEAVQPGYSEIRLVWE